MCIEQAYLKKMNKLFVDEYNFFSRIGSCRVRFFLNKHRQERKKSASWILRSPSSWLRKFNVHSNQSLSGNYLWASPFGFQKFFSLLRSFETIKTQLGCFLSLPFTLSLSHTHTHSLSLNNTYSYSHFLSIYLTLSLTLILDIFSLFFLSVFLVSISFKVSRHVVWKVVWSCFVVVYLIFRISPPN